MIGGYQIIDLTGLDLEIKAEQTLIADAKVLKKLDYLKDYIEDGFNYDKPLNNKLKPILLRLRDKKANEKQEASVWANLSKKDDNLTFMIEAVVDSTTIKTIQIEVIFELKQDEAGNDYYGIKTAKYLLTNNMIIKSFNGISPSVADSGKVLGVGNNGEYELKTISGVTSLFCHPITVTLNSANQEGKFARIDCLIFNTRATAYTSFKEMLGEMTNVSRILATGKTNGAVSNNDLHIAYEIYYSPINGIVSCNAINISTGSDEYLLISQNAEEFELFTETGFSDGVNQIL